MLKLANGRISNIATGLRTVAIYQQLRKCTLAVCNNRIYQSALNCVIIEIIIIWWQSSQFSPDC